MSSPSSFVNKKIVQAGAGAGKTTDLVALFLQETENFYTQNNQWPKIIVTTFTRKATQELKERIQQKILDLQDQIEKKLISDDEEEQKAQLKRLHFLKAAFEFVNKKSFVQISTIHGVLNLFLRSIALEINLSADFSFISAEESFTSAQKLIKNQFLQDENFVDLLEDYDFRTLTQLFLKLFQYWMILGKVTGVKSEENKALIVENLKKSLALGEEIIQQILSETEQDQWIEYLKNMFGIVSQMQSLEKGLEPAQIQNLLEALSVKKPTFSNKKMPFSKELEEDFKEWRDQAIDLLGEYLIFLETADVNDQVIGLIEKFVEPFCQSFLAEKLNSGLITMSDLELLSVYALRMQPQIADAFVSQWNLWMVDEYQDTSPVQEMILNALIKNTKSYYVGDPQQSIYLFRGARSEVFHNKVLQIEKLGGVFDKKMINYRSLPQVLHFINELFPKIDSRMFQKMEVGKIVENATHQVPQIWHVPQESTQELALAHRAQEILSAGCSAESVAILVRTNRQIQMLTQVFDEYGLPYQVHGSGQFYSRREVQDLLLILKFVLNPWDDLNLISLLRSPWIEITDQSLVNLRQRVQGHIWSAIVDSEEVEFCPLKTLYQESEESGILFAIKKFIHSSQFLSFSEVYDTTGRREANIWKFLSLMDNESRRPGFSWLQFILDSKLAASGELENEDGDATPVISPDRINIMTIHSSKGLQFEHVLIPFLNKKPQLAQSQVLMVDEVTGQFTVKVMHPESSLRVESAFSRLLNQELRLREKDEALRVFYVACTRAISGLTLFLQEPYEKGSIGSILPFESTEGAHSYGTCQYHVRRDIPDPSYFTQQGQSSVLVRNPYLDSWEKDQQISFTQENSPSNRPSVDGVYKSVMGTEFHDTMESLKYLSKQEVMAGLNSKKKEALDFLISNSQLPLLQMIQTGQTEFGFSFQEGQQKFAGQIDLWCRLDNQVYILDYKTGSSRYEEKAFQQLSFYHYGLLRLHEILESDIVNLVVAFPYEQKLSVRISTRDSCLQTFRNLTDRNFSKTL